MDDDTDTGLWPGAPEGEPGSSATPGGRRPLGTEWAPLDGRPRRTPGNGLDPADLREGGPADPANAGKPIGRRVFLGLAAAGAVGIAFGSELQKVVGSVVSKVSSTAGNGLGALIPGADRFRLYTVTNAFPSIPTSHYRLRVEGLVEKPMTLTYEQLQTLPRTQLVKPFQCVTGWRVPDVEWAGVLLGDLIDLAKPTAQARAVEFTSYDGVYTESLTMDEAHRSDVLVAYEMLDAPITSGHGGPVRLYVAPMYGYKSIKWLKSISLVHNAVPGFWEQEGYDVEAWIGRSNGLSGAPVD